MKAQILFLSRIKNKNSFLIRYKLIKIPKLERHKTKPLNGSQQSATKGKLIRVSDGSPIIAKAICASKNLIIPYPIPPNKNKGLVSSNVIANLSWCSKKLKKTGK